MACSKNVQAIQNPARLSDSSLKPESKTLEALDIGTGGCMFWKKWNEPLCVGSIPIEHPGDANINTKRSFLFFRTCSRRLPISKAYTVLDSGLQTGVRKPRRILDGLNVLRARHAKRLVAIS